jgi:signal transduction histidine kinase
VIEGTPAVQATRIEPLDSSPVNPRALQPDAPLPDTNDFYWAEVEGTVDFLTVLPGRIRLELTDGSGSLRAYFLEPDIPDSLLHKGARVILRGLCEAGLNERSERVPGVLWVANRRDAIMILPVSGRWTGTPLVRFAELASANHDLAAVPVRVQGRLTAQTPGESLTLEDQGQRLVAYSAQQLPIAHGSWVEVVGKPEAGSGGVALAGAWYRVIATPQSSQSAQAPSAPSGQPGLPLLTSIREIKNLTPEEAERKYPVRLRGVATYVFQFDNSSCLLQDDSGGLYVGQGNLPLPELRAGRLVEVEGETGQGSFAPIVTASRRTVLGLAPMPRPSRASLDFLLTGKNENLWVEQEGVIRTVRAEGSPPVLAMSVMGRGAQFQVDLYTPGVPSFPTNLTVDTAIRVRGVCGAVWNDRRQNIGFRVYVPDAEEIEILEPAPLDPFTIPRQVITNLMQWDGKRTLSHRVKVQGTVTLCADAQTFFLQDETGALRVRSAQAASLKPGDRVEVVGFPEAQGFSPMLSEALVRVTGDAPLPVAQLTSLEDVMKGRHDAARVRMEAQVVSQKVQGDQQQLSLRINEHPFHATLATNRGQIAPIPPGSRIALTGICLVAVDATRTPQSFDLFLNSASDVAVLERPAWWSLKHTLTLLVVLAVVLLGAFGWIRTLRRQVEDRTRQLRAEMEDHKHTSARLREKTELLQAEIEERKRTEAKLEKVHRELVDASRRAGMAEVATGVLHNVGNVLNSVNVSSNLISERVKASQVTRVGKVAQLLSEQSGNLGRFFTEDDRGRQLPSYVAKLAEHLIREQQTLLDESESLARNVDHIKEIVVTQQSYAKRAGIIETIAVTELVEDALRIHTQAYLRHGVTVRKEFEPTPPITTDRHKVLQILVNFLSNAKYACDEGPTAEKQVTIRVARAGADRVRIEVSDNGVGVLPENLKKIFSHGFTTRRSGHGFGLHSGALAAKELGGSVAVRSEGSGKGATFIVELPLQMPIQEARSET